jgi:hypothetical protein
MKLTLEQHQAIARDLHASCRHLMRMCDMIEALKVAGRLPASLSDVYHRLYALTDHLQSSIADELESVLLRDYPAAELTVYSTAEAMAVECVTVATKEIEPAH